MMLNTHKILAVKFIENIDDNKMSLIKEKHFVWGNIKPDCVSKYKFHKHYLDESFPMIIRKIQFLSTLSITYIYRSYSLNKFNQELGVICHFLCDYFCVPHNQRWEFKTPTIVKDHLLYEKDLNKFLKDFTLKSNLEPDLSLANIEKFILNCQKEYESTTSFENDLVFSYFICNSIINFIFDRIFYNESLSMITAKVV